MLISAEVVGTPQYVLMNNKQRIGPTAVRLESGVDCMPIYGFSTKDAYDRFCTNTDQALTPYPLVTFYLREQVALPDEGLKLVVVDALGPGDANLHAATMQTVLDAQENRLPHVTSDYRMVFDPVGNVYRVDEDSI